MSIHAAAAALLIAPAATKPRPALPCAVPFWPAVAVLTSSCLPRRDPVASFTRVGMQVMSAVRTRLRYRGHRLSCRKTCYCPEALQLELLELAFLRVHPCFTAGLLSVDAVQFLHTALHTQYAAPLSSAASLPRVIVRLDWARPCPTPCPAFFILCCMLACTRTECHCRSACREIHKTAVHRRMECVGFPSTTGMRDKPTVCLLLGARSLASFWTSSRL